MVEAAGLALTVLSTFSQAVQCFEYIQVARNFDHDYQTAVLKLDVARLRLTRWGSSVGLDRIDDTTHTLPGAAGSVNEYELAKDLLEQIVQLFEVAEKQSGRSRSEPDNRGGDTGDATKNLDHPVASLHQKLENLSLKRFKPSTVIKKAKWALYKEKYLNRLIDDSTGLIDELVDLFPAAQAEQKRLCNEEGAELAKDENIPLLVPVLDEQDHELSASVKEQRTQNGGQTFYTTFAGSHNYGLQQGSFSGQQTNNFGVPLQR